MQMPPESRQTSQEMPAVVQMPQVVLAVQVALAALEVHTGALLRRGPPRQTASNR